ncbi:MAG: cyclic phosphodiesterase-like protein [Parcubacteria group bacterium]|nr:cyclic phosphodiesterase-like protein [Parcubacteria group bacterium]
MMDPHSDRTEGYHLFLVPPEALAEKLRWTINALAESYSGPKFVPHVTLLSGIPAEPEDVVIEKATQLAKSCAPFELILGEEGMEDAYFRAFYMRIQESEALTAAHARAGALFGVQQEGIYVPHLSLLYGNYPEERKRAALAALPVPEGTSFLVDRIHVYRTEGRASEWQKVSELAF